jgi:hypothetical protein
MKLLSELHKHRIAMIDVLKGNVSRKGSSLFLADFGISVDYSFVPVKGKKSIYGQMNSLTWTKAKTLDFDIFLYSKCEDCFEPSKI